MDLLDRDPASSETFLQISADGVGRLDGKVAYSESAITAAMPDFTAGSVLIGLEGETRNAIALSKRANGAHVQLLDVVGGANGKVAEIHGVSRQVVGPLGERPGMSLAQAGVDPATCRAGTNLWQGQAICTSRAAANVKLMFSFKGETLASNRLPPPDTLERAELQRIIWSPKV